MMAAAQHPEGAAAAAGAAAGPASGAAPPLASPFAPLAPQPPRVATLQDQLAAM
jgi:hypothetical protein